MNKKKGGGGEVCGGDVQLEVHDIMLVSGC